MRADNDSPLPECRSEAKAAGVPHYYTGRPCTHGHIDKRYTQDGSCMECKRISALRRFYENQEERNAKGKAYFKARYADDPDFKRRAIDYQKTLRLDPDFMVRKREYEAKRREGRTDDEKATVRSYMRDYQRKRHQASPRARLNRSMSGGIYKSIVAAAKNGRKWESLVGYTVEDLRSHLEKKFQEGMTWDNYGKWHIDHVIPKSVFNYETPDDMDFRRAWAMSNLQPLWKKDNLTKHARLAGEFQPSFALAA